MRKPPKSLGREWVEKEVLPRIESYQIPVQDAARTYCEHIAIQIGKVTGKNQSGSMLVTGGGAFNGFLISRIQANTPVRIEIPDNKIVNFKEAIIFALLGMLRIEEKSNCLASVTGADRDICGGAVYLP
jgi:anhydro-N-acetylmuramic acid kinase